MHFKVVKGCDLYDKLQVLFVKLDAARETIKQALIAKGFSGIYAYSSSNYLVACDAVEIKKEPPAGWKKVGDGYRKLFYPKAVNKKECKEMAALPRIKCNELNELVNFSFHVDGNLAIHHRPGVVFCDGYVLLYTNSREYKPVADMIEIMESEFMELERKVIE